jgi:hypothetical protein
MDHKSIKKIGFIVLGVAASASLVFALKIGSVFLMFWQLAPYIVMGYLLKEHSDSRNKSLMLCVAIVIASFLGIYCSIDIIYLHPDPQGGIALFILPVIQLIAYGVFNMIYLGVKNFRLR